MHESLNLQHVSIILTFILAKLFSYTDHQEPQSPLIVSNYHPPSPPSPLLPKGHHPPTTRVRGTSDLPKTRIRRHPKTVAMAAAVNAQALDSRTQIRIPTHRQPFYNT